MLQNIDSQITLKASVQQMTFRNTAIKINEPYLMCFIIHITKQIHYQCMTEISLETCAMYGLSLSDVDSERKLSPFLLPSVLKTMQKTPWKIK